MYSKPQKIAAEFVGTFVFVFFGVGAIVADQFLRTSSPSLPGVGRLGIALAQGLAFGIGVTALGHISGGHFNPAITIGLWVTRKISTFDTIVYWLAQLGGGIAAAYLLRTLPFEAWSSVQMGTPDLAIGITRATGIIFEAVMTFVVVFVYFATREDKRNASMQMAGLAVGLTVTIAVLLGAPFTGAALNPARVIGPALAANHWTNIGVYMIGPLGGGVVAGWLYDTLFLSKKEI
ncbi:MAG TPA: MIP family channel protein [Candidatus Acidoferrales bacterium]|jgi:glycerol uptake facilitator protein|nr:MIP family channel protein [Candidatus Acidoferrales bacterium]